MKKINFYKKKRNIPEPRKIFVFFVYNHIYWLNSVIIKNNK